MRIREMDDQKKIDLYRKGHYGFSCPSVCTMMWTEKDWIAYIDACEGWREVKK